MPRPTRPIRSLALPLALTVASLAAAPAADAAAPGWSATQHEIDARIAVGGELAVDPASRRLFVADRDYYSYTNVRILDPKIGVVGVDDGAWQRAIGLGGLPWTTSALYISDDVMPKILPTPQVPVGLAVDTKRKLVVTSNTMTDSATVVSMDAGQAGAGDLVPVGEHPMGVAVDERDGRAYVANTNSASVSVIDLAGRRVVGTIDGVHRPTMLSLDAQRRRLYVGNYDHLHKDGPGQHEIAVVDLADRKVVGRLAVPPNTRPTVDAAAGKLYATSFNEGTVTVIDVETGKTLKVIDTKTTPNTLWLDAERHRLYSADLQRKTVTVIDGTTDEVVLTVPLPAASHSAAVDPVSHRVYASHLTDGRVTVLTVTGPAPAAAPASPRLGRPRFVRSGRLAVRARTPVAGRLAVTLRATVGGKRRVVARGRSGRLKAGAKASVRLRLTTVGHRRLAGRSRLATRATLRLTPSAGGTTLVRRASVTLRAPAR